MSERRSPTEERLTPPKCLNYSSASPTSSGYLGRPSPQAAPESPRGKPTARNFPPELGAPLLESAARGWEESERSGQESEPQRESALATHGKAAVYGLINAVVVAPVMIGFAAIIFRHPAFHADAQMYSRLVKLVIFSSTVHQIAFSASSSLDFAIGQVQDAGLIFLSKMSGDIAEAMKDDHPDAMVATTLVGLSLSTALLGVALIITGKLQLAMLVQYLPLPVVGGYLAFIGLYCLEAGLSLMSGVQVTSLLGFDFLPQWEALLQPEALLSVMPGVVCGIGILLVLQARNPAQFSAQLGAIIAQFSDVRPSHSSSSSAFTTSSCCRRSCSASPWCSSRSRTPSATR